MAKRRRNNRYGRGRFGKAGLILLLVLCVVAAIVVRRTVFVVKEIQVVGNVSIARDQIVSLSGIGMGESIFKLSEADVREAFSHHGTLSFEGMDIERPSRVRIYVRERTARAVTNYAGLSTLIDEHGYTIWQSREVPEEQAQSLPVVTGLDLAACEVGRRAVSNVPYQVDVMSEMLTNIYAQQLSTIISELNVADLDNLYIMTRPGMMVKFGDVQHVQDKLLWMQNVLAHLTAEGTVTGILDVSGGNDAVYQAPGIETFQ